MRQAGKTKKRNLRFAAGWVAVAAGFGLVIWLFLGAVFSFLGKAEAEGAENLQKSITRASVQCYAIEGRYPPSVEYLEENYGIRIDKERYAVFYDGFASNIMPDITVVPLEEGGGANGR